jgi:starch synthase
MHIVLITPEAAPFSRTGALGVFAGALPAELAGLGHQVRVISPFYQTARSIEPPPAKVASGTVPLGTETVEWTLFRSPLNPGGAEYYLIGNDFFFDRPGLYGDSRGDYSDNCSRFIFFCRAALAASQALGDAVDVFHAHEWQTGLVPAFLRCSLYSHPFFVDAASVFMVQHIAEQGLFWHWDWPLLNLPWKHYHWKQMEYHGKISFIKGGLVYADLLNTGSPTCARELQTPEYGAGLEGVLSERAADFRGILPGIDTPCWDPEHDPHLPAPYSPRDPAGKAKCKVELLKRLEWSNDARTPVAAFLDRLDTPSGADLLLETLETLVRRPLRLVIHADGTEKYRVPLQRLSGLHPQRLTVRFAQDDEMTHLILAGSDLLLRPGLREPNAARALQALRYGTPIVAHRSGSLADVVTDATPEALEAGNATGFLFQEFRGAALLAAVDAAVRLCSEDAKAWNSLRRQAMRLDGSWPRCARAYVELYQRARESARARGGRGMS